jgi:hypothetical protein
MKRVFLVILSAFSFWLTSYTQAQKEKEVKSLLCQKWRLSRIEYFSKKTKNISMVVICAFGPDGSMTKIDEADTVKGKWSYNHRQKLVTTED